MFFTISTIDCSLDFFWEQLQARTFNCELSFNFLASFDEVTKRVHFNRANLYSFVFLVYC